MIAINNSLTDLLQCQQRMQNDTIHALQAFHQPQEDHTDDSLIDDTSTLNEKPWLYFEWILKIESIAAVSKWNPKQLTLGKVQGTFTKCLKSLTADVSRINVIIYFETTVFFGSNGNSCCQTVNA